MWGSFTRTFGTFAATCMVLALLRAPAPARASPAAYTFDADNVSAGTHTPSIVFANDYSHPSAGEDSNLAVQSIPITGGASSPRTSSPPPPPPPSSGGKTGTSGTTITIQASSMTASGCSYNSVSGSVIHLACNGRANATIRIAEAGSYQVGFTGYADLVTGHDPIAMLQVDGASDGTVTVSSAGAAPYTFSPVNLAAGSHQISIAFTNDYYNPSAGEDSNLDVQSIAITGGGTTPAPSPAPTPPNGAGSPVTVNGNVTHQTIDGFGAASDIGVTFTTAQDDLFFSPTNGVGLSLFRTKVPSDGSCSTINPTCASDELANMKAAMARGAAVWSASWSPPASMKTNHHTICNYNGTGASSLKTSSYSDFATYLSNYIASLKAQGVSLEAISIQNEPDRCPTTYSGAMMSPAAFDTFIKENLGPKLAAAGQSAVQIMLPDSSSWRNVATYGNTVLQDSAAAQYVGILAGHDYTHFDCAGNPSSCSYALGRNMGKRLWETEVSSFGECDASIGDALTWAKEINDWMAFANANAWHYWWLMAPSGGTDNEGLICGNGTVRRALYAMGNYSKFVRPGWVRIDATENPVDGVFITAFKNPSTGKFAIVAINQNRSGATLTLGLSGLSAGSVTPWITSANDNLAAQSTVGVGHGTFTYTLPAQSVTTFVSP